MNQKPARLINRYSSRFVTPKDESRWEKRQPGSGAMWVVPRTFMRKAQKQIWREKNAADRAFWRGVMKRAVAA